ncbi:hypothetical protein [Syntrophomonas wolfei]|nr:hypothetical protein [Syntrophomonas wolfei]
MPKIYDNIENYLKSGLITTLESSYRADFWWVTLTSGAGNCLMSKSF